MFAISVAGNIFMGLQRAASVPPIAVENPEMPGNGKSRPLHQDSRIIPDISMDLLLQKNWRDIQGSRNRLATWENWVRKDPLAAINHACASAEGTDREEMVASALGVWASSAPDAAAAWLSQAPAGLQSDAVIQELVGEWGKINPAAAAIWLGTLKDDSLKTSVAEVLAGTWAEQDGAAAVRWLESTWPDGEAGTALNLALENWAENDLEGLRRALGSLGDADAEIEAAKAVGEKISESDGPAAWSFANSLKDPSVRYETLMVVMETWANLMPSDAARMIDSTSDDSIRVDATRALVSKWILSDGELALRWLGTVKPGPQADAGYDAASEQWSSTRPIKSLDLALKIGDRDLRRNAIETAYAELLEQDPDSARKWLQSDALPEDQKRRLMESPR